MPQGYNFKRITATGVSTLSIAQFGQLHAITLNQLSTGATAASTGLFTVYNGTTTAAATDASVLGVCNPAASGVADYIYDALMPAGLTIQVGSAVAPIDFTVTFT